MSFYARFAAYYERVFPLREGTLAFLRARLPAAGRVLDLGCGTGHYCGRLAAAGIQAVGIDLDAGMIAAARVRYPAAEFRGLDLRKVGALAGAFAGAFCIGNVLPHVPLADLDAFLSDLSRQLAPGAPFVVQTVNFDRLLPLREPHRFADLDVGDGLVFRRAYVPARGGAVSFVTELREGERVVFSGEETLWPLPAAALSEHCARAGFDVAEHCGDFTGTSFVPASSGASVLVLRRHN